MNPTFQWIRLAQRIPVQIRLDHIPDGIQFRIGSSASIVIHKNQQNQSLIEMVKGIL